MQVILAFTSGQGVDSLYYQLKNADLLFAD